MPQPIHRSHCLAGLRGVRRHRKLPLADLASAIGVTTNSYLRYENGSRIITLDKACTLADTLNCTVDDLRHYRDEDQLFHQFGPATELNPLNSTTETASELATAPQAPPMPPPPPNDPNGLVVGSTDSLAARQLASWGEPS